MYSKDGNKDKSNNNLHYSFHYVDPSSEIIGKCLSNLDNKI